MAPAARWVGLDFTFEMLRLGPQDSARVQADMLHLPFGEGRFSLVTMAYGMRNVSDRKRAISEVIRVLSAEGRFVFLEFAKPGSSLLRGIYFAWLKVVQPLLGRLFFGDPETYRYISRSLEKFARRPFRRAETFG